MKDLISLGLWSETMRQKLVAANGSVQGIAEIPQHIKDIYRTVVGDSTEGDYRHEC